MKDEESDNSVVSKKKINQIYRFSLRANLEESC